jgi:hypothetical protein
VNVKSGDRRGYSIPEQVTDTLVALLVGDIRVALHCRRMRPRTEQTRAGREDRTAHPGERCGGFARALAHVGDELDLAGVQLTLYRPSDRPEPLLYRGRGIRLMARDGIHEEQLLLDADGKRLT